ncbi:hypothetical protein C7H84_30190 [Burkholderia sp. Nafp2/4-1b]|uniref:hypothetical protein n=1 Tax=Burkholderia sp. Nafp2/4-1b TaxID=2116686 RepID=UPI000EF9053E|nr:hypothetical protein [Burkholderia sp. Nafp2/4-1b]RKT99548.1 hypothetical protein C7H84_30190 [Burkholderia sp. Nafp2/4-1b]
MQTIKQLIKANSTGYSAAIGGRAFYVQGCDTGSTLTVTLTDANGNRDTVIGVGSGVKLVPTNGYVQVDITTTADANVQFIVTNGDIDVQLTQVGTNVTNTNANPVPVAIVSEPGAPFQVSAPVGQEVNVKVQGTVAVTGATLTATNVGITQGGTITENAPVAAPAFNGAAPNQVSLLAASAGRRRVAFKNAGTGIAYIGGAGVTPTNAVISLNPGDVWHDNDGAPAAWYGTSDAGTTINVQVMA